MHSGTYPMHAIASKRHRTTAARTETTIPLRFTRAPSHSVSTIDRLHVILLRDSPGFCPAPKSGRHLANGYRAIDCLNTPNFMHIHAATAPVVHRHCSHGPLTSRASRAKYIALCGVAGLPSCSMATGRPAVLLAWLARRTLSRPPVPGALRYSGDRGPRFDGTALYI